MSGFTYYPVMMSNVLSQLAGCHPKKLRFSWLNRCEWRSTRDFVGRRPLRLAVRESNLSGHRLEFGYMIKMVTARKQQKLSSADAGSRAEGLIDRDSERGIETRETAKLGEGWQSLIDRDSERGIETQQRIRIPVTLDV